LQSEGVAYGRPPLIPDSSAYQINHTFIQKGVISKIKQYDLNTELIDFLL
jgi:hypothetical protein